MVIVYYSPIGGLLCFLLNDHVLVTFFLDLELLMVGTSELYMAPQGKIENTIIVHPHLRKTELQGQMPLGWHLSQVLPHCSETRGYMP